MTIKIRKWLLRGGVALCLLVGLLLPASLVNAQVVTVSVDAPPTAAPSSPFTATVDITTVTDFDSAQFDVVFSPDILELTSVTDGLIGATTIPVDYWQVAPDRVRVIASLPLGHLGVTGSGYLCELHFLAIGSEGTSSDINLKNGLLGDKYAHKIPADWEGDHVDVGVPTEPTIAFSPTSFSFSATEGGDNPADQTLEIWNSGTGTLHWSVSDEATWLSLSPTSGSITEETSHYWHCAVTVSVDISGMTADDYSATITISDPEATNSPQTVPVSLGISVPCYTLAVTTSPIGGGSVPLDPPQPVGGYEAGTSVELTATANEGYAFGSWSVDLSGSTNPDTIIMDSEKSVTANFVEFSAPANVDMTVADPGVDSVDVSTKDLGQVDTTNMPEDVDPQEAYLVDSTGAGSFTLRFTDIANAGDIEVYKVVDTTWTEIPVTVIDATTIEVTITVGDPTLVFALPMAPPPPPAPGVGGTAYPPDKLAILAPWIALGVGLGVLGWFLVRRRRAYR